MHTLHLSGTHREMGRQHAAQAQAMLPAICRVITARQQELAQMTYDYRPVLAAAADFMAAHGRPTWEMLAGIGEGLGLDWPALQRYTLSSYLLDYRHSVVADESPALTAAQEGCTCFATAPPLSSAPLLAKNRDYRLDHVELQTLSFSAPAHGYRYLHLGSLGSPGVFSSGMNERGLAVADTHVLALDIGPGLPRYALMQEILEHCDSVAAACDYLRSVTHMGAGTLTLADAQGRLARVESAYRRPVIEMGAGWAVCANHFSSEALRRQWLDKEPPARRGNSAARLAFVAGQLAAAPQVDLAWAQNLLATHGPGQSALCRHPDATTPAATILATIFLPATLQVWLAAGTPCQAAWRQIGIGAAAWPLLKTKQGAPR